MTHLSQLRQISPEPLERRAISLWLLAAVSRKVESGGGGTHFLDAEQV
jgi:hypothetical protein